MVIGIRPSGEAHSRQPLGLAHLVSLEVRAGCFPLAAHGALVPPDTAGQSSARNDINHLVHQVLRPHQSYEPV